MNAIDSLLNPRSIAVVGASADLSKTTGRPVLYLQKHGYRGAIYPVNPRANAIAGLTCYPDVASLPATPDVGLVLLGPERAHQAVRELSARGAKAAIVFASGYTEVGGEGVQRQRALKEAAGGMRLLGPNTIGLVNLTESITLSASGALEMDHLPSGKIAVVSQSGGILGSLLSRAAGRGIGFSKLVSTSNEVDLDLADFVDYLVDDQATSVIALYMEGLRNVPKFRAAAQKAAKAGKPIIVFKVGRSEAGARSAVSHTGALAGADAMYDALFRQVGAVRANAFSDLLDIPAAMATGRRLHGKRVAVLTSTGGAGTLVADSLGIAGFETSPPDGETARRLRGLQQDDSAVLDRNPIDVTLAGLQPKLLQGVIGTLLDSPAYDAVVVIVGSSALQRPELVAGAIKACLPASGKPVIAYVSPHAPHVEKVLNAEGVPAFSAPESCAVALSAMLKAVEWQAPDEEPDTAPVQVGSLSSGAMNELESKQLFSRFGIPAVRERAVKSPVGAGKAACGFDDKVVIKVLSRDILHKSEIGGVVVGVEPHAISDAISAMAATVLARTGTAPEGYLIQEMVKGGVELILGFLRDPQLGPAVLLGMGGVTAELMKDTVIRLAPVTRAEARAMVRELKGAPLLDGFRGRPPCDIDALVSAIVAFSRMVLQLGDRLAEAEINPLFVLSKGKGVLAADGVVILRSSPTDESRQR
jgi:acyl-CoA synthetase (NDP forming)